MATQQSIIFQSGQSVVLPAGSRIDSYILDSGATLSSSCDNLGEADTYACLQYDFAESDAPDPGALQELSIVSIEVGGTVYEINLDAPFSIAGAMSIINAITSPVFIVYSGARDTTTYDDRAEYSLGVKVPSTMVGSVKFKVTGTGFTNGLYVIPTEIEDCDCVEVTSGGDATETECDNDE